MTREFQIRTDCRHYDGERPCRARRLCPGCEEYSPLGTRVLIVKFGAMGDALRTTPVLRVLHRLHDPLEITWITDDASYQVLQGNPLIHRLWRFDLETWARLSHESFDFCLSFDKVPAALSCAEAARATTKLGFAPSPEGRISIYNPQSRYSILLGLSDPLKFEENRKSYMQIIFEMVGWEFAGEEYVFQLTEGERAWATRLRRELGIREGEPVVGLNTGCGPVFATKKWTQEGYAGLARELHRQFGLRSLLLGGPAEEERNAGLARSLPEATILAGLHPVRRFAALLGSCRLLVTGDTLAMHLGIAQGVPTVALFGSTAEQEIDLYGRGEKVITDFACAPCYLKTCPLPVSCMGALPMESVLAACQRTLGGS